MDSACLRALLIQKSVKLSATSFYRHSRLRALLIQKSVKPDPLSKKGK